MDPESIEKYTAMAKQFNIPQGERINFIRDQLKEDREARRLQREQKMEEERLKEEKRIADEERSHRLQLETEKQKMEAEKRKKRD